MVKVLKCHNFRSQTILPVEEEPHVLSSGKDIVFVGTSESTIEVFKLGADKQWEKYCDFQTGASITQLVYNHAGDYVATVECKKSRRAEVVSVKAYLNWTIAHRSPGYRTRVRVASLGYRSNKVETDSRLEVIDIPCPKPARIIATCQQTGNFAIAFDHTVQLFHLVEKTIPNSQTTYLDIVIFLELTFDYQVCKVDLCEEYFTTASQTLAQVFKIVYSEEVKRTLSGAAVRDPTPIQRDTPSGFSRRVSSTVLSSLTQQNIKLSSRTDAATPRDSNKFSNIGDRSSTTPSPALSLQSKSSSLQSIEDDTDFVQWTFSDQDCLVDGVSLTRRSTASKSSTITLPSLEKLLRKAEVEGTPPTVKDLRGGSHATTGQISLTTLLTRKLDSIDHEWLQLQLIPTYQTGSESRHILSENTVPVHSAHHVSLAGISCLMTGSRTGFMYSLMPETKCLSTYRYTQNAKQVWSDGHLLHVVKQSGLETYTARCHIAATHNTHNLNNVTQTCPAANTDICLVGMHQFLGTREITLTDHHVILLLKVPDSSSESVWNIYGLEKPSPADLYRDMVQIAFGSKYQQSSSETYHHLLLEGHMILRSNMIGPSAFPADVTIIRDQLMESCALLGDYYSLPSCVDWSRCLPYYMMSGLSPADVVRQALQYKQHSKVTSPYCYGQGLVQYLSYILFLDEDPLDLKQSDCNLILEVCAEVMADRLADVILFSRLRNFVPEKAVQLLRQGMKQRPVSSAKTKTKELLAVAALNLELCDPELAHASLSAVDKRDMTEVCISHHQVLHTDFMELSPLSQLMRCHCPEVLILVLVALYDRGVIPLDLAVKLLQGKSGVPELHRNTHVMDYLENLVNDGSRKFVFEDAVALLCEIYVKRIKEWEPPTCREVSASIKFKLPKGSGHFGRRHKWLDFLAPFTGSQSISNPCQFVVRTAGRRTGIQGPQLLQCQKNDVVCSCFHCNEELLKLQSLLCSHHCTAQLAEKVMTLLSDVTTVTYYDSLRLLCMVQTSTADAVKVVVEKYPKMSAMFAMATLGNSVSEWEGLLNHLLSKLKTQTGNSVEKENVYLSTLKDVLREMAGQFSPDNFLQILPGHGNFFFFMPYIQLCIDKSQTSLLRKKILERGDNLAQSL